VLEKVHTRSSGLSFTKIQSPIVYSSRCASEALANNIGIRPAMTRSLIISAASGASRGSAGSPPAGSAAAWAGGRSRYRATSSGQVGHAHQSYGPSRWGEGPVFSVLARFACSRSIIAVTLPADQCDIHPKGGRRSGAQRHPQGVVCHPRQVYGVTHKPYGRRLLSGPSHIREPW
jgi:hypothetical protein